MNTGNNERFVRFHWEHPCGGEWRPLSKGGGYRKWFGNDLYSVRWGDDAAAIRAAHLSGTALRNTERFFQPTLCYTLMGRGSLGVRLLDGSAFDGTGLVIDPVDADSRVELAALLNTRVPAFLCRLFSQSSKFRGGYVERVPIPYDPVWRLRSLGAFAVAKKSALTSLSIVERAFDFTSLSACGSTLKEMAVCAVLHSAEGMIEANTGEMYHLSRTELASVYAETGQPTGLFSLLPGYTDLPVNPGTEEVPADLMPFLEGQGREVWSSVRLTELRASLRRWYERGPGPEIEETETGDGDQTEEEDDDVGTYARIPIRPETFLEELSEKIGIHPISVFGLLKEGIERDGWRCLPEEQRLARDRLTVQTLQLLGHRWPRQIEASEPIPAWADPDGVIPLTEGTSERTLGERIVERNSFRSSAAEPDPFRSGDAAAGERNGMNSVLRSDFADLMGKPLDQWLATEFFKHHTSQFKKRPIAWQVQSGKFTARKKPAFACLVYYHKLDGDLLPKLRKQYAGNLQQRMETELRGIEGIPAGARSDRQEVRRNELGDQIQELQEFDAKLRDVQESAFAADDLCAAAIQDGLLCLRQAWLRRLGDAIRSGPLGQWLAAAREAAIHADLPGWMEVAMSQLDRHCTRVGPDDSEWESDDDPTPITAARFICAQPSQMVTDALRHANGGWEGQVSTVVIALLRRQISEKQDRQKAIKAELKAPSRRTEFIPFDVAEKGDATENGMNSVPPLAAIGELKAELDRLKAEIRDLQAQVDDIQTRCDRLRAMITDWQCPGVEGWECWLAQQPLYDAISSVDGHRRPPTTAQEWIAQEQSYFPDINDGVRVNIAPLQKAGLLAADVLAKKDLDKAIADRAEWRRDERRWVREGRLPRPGWWPET